MLSNIIPEDGYDPSIFYYIPNFLNKCEEKYIFEYLQSMNDFIPNPKHMNGNSRLQKWYQNDGKYFCPQWKTVYPHWESFDSDYHINNMIEKVQKYINTINLPINIPNINSCLINKYMTGDNFIAPHRDSELSFGIEPTIIGLSIGATRTILFERNDKQSKFTFNLESGSLFIMAGSSQRAYKHSIEKSDCKDIRYSMTFREFIVND